MTYAKGGVLLQCPYCKKGARTIYTSRTKMSNGIRRTRQCMQDDCGKRFTTFELPSHLILPREDFDQLKQELESAIRLIQESRRRVPFRKETIDGDIHSTFVP